nr:MAG TPA: hypothetical protein [Caudoviricetes sp.]
MRLYDVFPTEIEYKGNKYKLKLTVSNVLEAFDTLKRTDLIEEDKLDYCLFLFFEENYPMEIGLLNAVFKLIDAEKAKSKGKRTFDFTQDAALIYAAFWQVYGIDLMETPLHWYKFIALLQGLPDGTRLAEIIKIRTMPLPKPDKYNVKERENLIRLKREYAIKTTEEEKRNEFQQGLLAMFNSLKAKAGD